MGASRVSIAGLMAVVALLGATFSALHAETEFAASVLLTLALLASGLSLLGHLAARGPGRAAWTGFLVLGAGYLALCVGPWSDEHLMPRLVTTLYVDGRYSVMQFTPTRSGERVWTADGLGREFAGGTVFGEVDAETLRFNVSHDRGTTSHYTATQLRAVSPDGYRRLCHSALSLWAGIFGAFLSHVLFGRRRKDSSPRMAIRPAQPRATIIPQ